MFIREGSLLFRGELGSFQKTKKSCTAKTVKKKLCKGSHGKKSSTCFYYHYFEFLCQKIRAQAIAHQKYYAQPKCEKKVHAP